MNDKRRSARIFFFWHTQRVQKTSSIILAARVESRNRSSRAAEARQPRRTPCRDDPHALHVSGSQRSGTPTKASRATCVPRWVPAGSCEQPRSNPVDDRRCIKWKSADLNLQRTEFGHNAETRTDDDKNGIDLPPNLPQRLSDPFSLAHGSESMQSSVRPRYREATCPSPSASPLHIDALITPLATCAGHGGACDGGVSSPLSPASAGAPPSPTVRAPARIYPGRCASGPARRAVFGALPRGPLLL
jgi:hypothetical protein